MEQYERMVKESIPSLITKLSIPTIISMLITSIYSMADTFFVSRLGDSQSAAISVVFSLQTLIQSIAYTIGVGSGAMISRSLGEKDNKKANTYSSQGFFLALLFGIFFLGFGLIFKNQIGKWLGASNTSLPYVNSFILWIIIASPFMMMSFVLNNILRSEGKAIFSMIGLGFGSVLNIVLDPILITTCNLGVDGAGIATMISQIVSFVILFSFFLFKKSITSLSPKYISKDIKTYKEVFKCGVPTLFRQGFSTSSNILLSFLGKPYGDALVAALGITNKIYIFCRSVVIGFGQGFQPVLGYCYGAKRYDRIKKAFWFTLLLQTGFCVLATVAVGVFPGQLTALFRNSEDVINIGRISVRMLMISLPFLGFSTIVNQSLQIIGYSKSATFLASCRQGIIFTPMIFLLEFLFKSNGLCLTQPLSDFVTALITIPFCIYFFKVIK